MNQLLKYFIFLFIIVIITLVMITIGVPYFIAYFFAGICGVMAVYFKIIRFDFGKK